MPFCSNCGTKIEEGVKFCSNCGKPVGGAQGAGDSTSAQENNPNLIPCPSCGASVSKQATTCPRCGAPLQKAQAKFIIKRNSKFAGLMARLVVKLGSDKGPIVAKLNCGESFSMDIEKDTTFYVKMNGAMAAGKTIVAKAGKINRFSGGASPTGFGTVVSEVDVIDSGD